MMVIPIDHLCSIIVFCNILLHQAVPSFKTLKYHPVAYLPDRTSGWPQYRNHMSCFEHCQRAFVGCFLFLTGKFIVICKIVHHDSYWFKSVVDMVLFGVHAGSGVISLITPLLQAWIKWQKELSYKVHP